MGPSRSRRCWPTADSALNAGRSANPAAVDKNLGIIKQYKPRIASMLKAYCKEEVS